MVKNVSQYKDKKLDVRSDKVRAFGIDWSIKVNLVKEGQDKYVYAYLCYDPVLKSE